LRVVLRVVLRVDQMVASTVDMMAWMRVEKMVALLIVTNNINITDIGHNNESYKDKKHCK
jgi:hypothetical protein